MLWKPSRRDIVLVLLGASGWYIFSAYSTYAQSSSLLANDPQSLDAVIAHEVTVTKTVSRPTTITDAAHGVTVTKTVSRPTTITEYVSPKPTKATTLDLGVLQSLPETTVVAHAPGWTIFQNLYMAGGALIILTSSDPSSFPPPELMTSTGLPGNLTNDAQRMPTERDLAFMTPSEAQARWGGDIAAGERNRVLTVEGTTLLYNDPPQFLAHYFHFVAELIYGTWAFLYGAFADQQVKAPPAAPADASFTPPLLSTTTPTINRAVFIHSDVDGWRDGPGFNGYFMRAVFPSLTIEVATDWLDRVNATSASNTQIGRAWHFPLALLTDRSAAFRSPITGAYTQRTAAPPWVAMAKEGKIDLVGNWWASMRAALLRYAGGTPHENLSPQLQVPDTVVITYINRQGTRRHLRDEDNLALVAAMEDLVERKNREGKRKWEFHDVHAERLSLDEQVVTAAKTTIMLGVHGNGLTHLVLMKPTIISAVVEIFLPGGFARDYEWTSRSLGMSHYSIWNDTSFTHPHEPTTPAFPDGFHGTQIPVYAPIVAQVIEDHVASREQGLGVDISPVHDVYA